MTFQFFLAITFFIKKCTGTLEVSPQVTIPSGTLLGEVGLSLYNREFYKFWCIPFGKVERFEPSVPVEPWTGARDATFCTVRCTQFPFMGGDMFMSMASQEDCLVLNVFAPKRPPAEQQENLHPVMVYIHGGYFVQGSSVDYSGELFLDENIVLVTINYRLGPLGFLATGDGLIEGNLGLKDQVLGLKWVQKNIKIFGGNPDLVTIFGESAGAGAVAHHVLSPMSKGLFHHAIAQSGSSLCPWGYQARPFENFRDYAQHSNCTRETTQESVDCLKNLTVEQIVENNGRTKWLTELTHPLFPTIELEKPNKSDIFLPDHPLRMLETGNFNRVPFIIGVNEDEGAYQGGLLVRDADLLNDLNFNWLEKGAIGVGLDTRNITKSNLNKGLEKLRRFYYGNDEIDLKHLQNSTDMFSDAWFIHSMTLTVKHYSKHAPIYPYLFTKKGGLRLAEMMGFFDREVVSHGDELQYLFLKGAASSEADKTFSTNFIKLWVSFAYTGKPSNTWGSTKIWPFVETEAKELKVYQLDDDTAILTEPWRARMELWSDLEQNEFNEFKLYEHAAPQN